MKVLVTGATGFIGLKLCCELLRRGHKVNVLTRSTKRFPYPCHVFNWNGETNMEALSGVEGVIHLAGAPVVGKRWNKTYKKELWDSRVQGTQHLVKNIQKSGPDVRCFLSASAIGYYGDLGDQSATEDHPVGSDFLAELCHSWENASSQIKGVRKVIARIGLVLGRGGGLVDQLHSLFRCGLGSPVGDGQQWMSWVHREDLIDFFCRALEDSTFEGVYNLTAPHPVRNREFMNRMAERLHGFIAPKVPYAALYLTQGEVARHIVASQKVLPQRLLNSGFCFKHTQLDGALADCLPSHPHDYEFESDQWINRPQKEVFNFFSDETNLEKLTPHWVKLRILGKSTPQIEAGTQINYKLNIHGFPIKWRTEIKDWNPPHRFSDVQIKGPYKKWEHLHHFEDLANGTLMTDRVCFRIPMGYMGNILLGSFIRKDVDKIFSYRNQTIQDNW